ncbi:NUDIX domain-containing protein [Devosia sp. MC532]|nr:NUDIX domain-containing protein [Devosia sp. MC532]
MAEGQVEKLCPFVLRGVGPARQILAFRHPLAGLQIVKGTRELGEEICAGAQREFLEETGYVGDLAEGPRWSSANIADGQLWHFVPVSSRDLPETFSCTTSDDGGHEFLFFWHGLDDPPLSPDWHIIFQRALADIRHHMR